MQAQRGLSRVSACCCWGSRRVPPLAPPRPIATPRAAATPTHDLSAAVDLFGRQPDFALLRPAGHLLPARAGFAYGERVHGVGSDATDRRRLCVPLHAPHVAAVPGRARVPCCTAVSIEWHALTGQYRSSPLRAGRKAHMHMHTHMHMHIMSCACACLAVLFLCSPATSGRTLRVSGRPWRLARVNYAKVVAVKHATGAGV